MKNRIDQVLTFSNKEQYMVIDQGIYQQTSYLFVCQITEAGDDLTDRFVILEESLKEGKVFTKKVTNPELLKKLGLYFQKRQEEQLKTSED